MVNVTLDDRDRAVLQQLRHRDTDVESLASDVGCSPSSLQERLPELADNGLVERLGSDESGGGGLQAVYSLTEDGERAILASGSGTGTLDERIDTAPEVDERIESFDLRPDREDALRSAFAYLQFWGEAFAGEIADAGYTEHPAGFESPSAWWDGCVRDRLAELPAVEPPDSVDAPWRYGGEPTVESDSRDGRAVLDPELASRNSPRLTLERLDLDENERHAVRSAFSRLVLDGELESARLEDRLSEIVDGTVTADRADRLREALEALPGIELDDGMWRYRPADGGPTSIDPDADVSGGLPGQPEGSDE